MGITLVSIPVDDLWAFVIAAFQAMGTSEDEAKRCARGLMESELRCLPGQGQGVRRLPTYHERISNCWIRPGADYEILKESPALALVDGHIGLGSVVAQKSMELAIKKAKISGIGTVIVKNSTHYGSSAVPARIAIEHDCIGIAITNAGPELAPWGGREGRVGTNPWGLVAPTGGDFPVVLDFAITTAGKGMMRWYEREGKKMPLDWALTPDGHETDDPSAAMAGALLGIGQYKGYGLAMFTDILTGVISGGAFGLTPYADKAKQDVAHTFIAIDIDWFMPIDEFKGRMNDFIAEIKSSALRPDFDEILVPGEIDYRRETGYRETGAKLDAAVFDELKALADTLGIAFPFERTVVTA